MNPTSERPEQKPPPSLLALPVELQTQIIAHLHHDEYPSQACLRRTHPSFLDVIPKSAIRSPLTETELCNQLLRTELDHAYLFPPAHYPCYFCLRVQPLDAFVATVDPFALLLFDGHRCCLDCRSLKRSKGDGGRSFLDSLVWIESTLEELPMPPSRPRLRLSSAATTTSVQTGSDGIPADVRRLMRSELYEEVSVLVNRKGWDLWWVLKCVFSFDRGTCG